MCTLNVALELEGVGVLPVAVLACSMAFPGLVVLLFKFQVVFHVVHEPNIILRTFVQLKHLKVV